MAFPLTLDEWLLATVVVVLGAIVQGSIGFGVAMLGAPLLFLINPALVPAPVLILGMGLPVLILMRDYQAVKFRDVGWVLPGMVVGSGLGGLVLGIVSEQALGLLFGVLVLLGIALSFGYRIINPTRPWLLSAGLVASFMATTTSIGGPPLALAFQNMRGPRLRGTLSACFVPGAFLSLAALAWAGRLGWGELMSGLSLYPAIILGFLLSGRLTRLMDRQWLRPTLLLVSGLAAVISIVHSLG